MPILRCMGDSISSSRDAATASETGRRLSLAMLGYYLAVIGVITLVPFRFVVPETYLVLLRGTVLDTAANVLLFVPLGFLYRLARPHVQDRIALRVLLLGAAASGVIEAIQLFEPARFSSPIDVGANSLGAWVGALAADQVTRFVQADSRLVARLSLEIPLMGLVYLLIPLLWLSSLAAGGEILRFGAVILPGLFGAQLLAFVHRYRPGRPGVASSGVVASAATFGMFVGVFPAAATFPVATLVVACMVGGHVYIAMAVPTAAGEERRFEGRALRAALPFYATYLIAIASLARSTAGLAGLGRVDILRTLELAVAFTVLGYLLAEWRGRLEESKWEVCCAVITRAAPLATAVASLRFLPDSPTTAAIWLVATVGSSLYGAGLYHLQRAHIRALISTGVPEKRMRSAAA